MTFLAPEVWPPEQRRMYCPQATKDARVDCRTKQGNPFGPFWDAFHIDFLGDRGIPPGAALGEALPPRVHFVVAMRGAPASFPEKPEHRQIARYIDWTATRHAAADAWIARHLPRPLVAAHLRAGADWKRACDNAAKSGTKEYMASPQCDHGTTITKVCNTFMRGGRGKGEGGWKEGRKKEGRRKEEGKKEKGFTRCLCLSVLQTQRTHAHTHTRTHTRTCTHTQTHAHTHTHTQTRKHTHTTLKQRFCRTCATHP